MSSMDKERLLEEIAEKELEMFLDMPAEEGASVQKPEIFKLTRRMAHAAHGESFLRSYLHDLTEAQKKGRNLVREKYAHMNGQLDPVADKETADAIAEAEKFFLEQAATWYPDIIKAANSAMFSAYLRKELETLSKESLDLYSQEMREAKASGTNPALDRHNWLGAALGKGERLVPLPDKN